MRKGTPPTNRIQRNRPDADRPFARGSWLWRHGRAGGMSVGQTAWRRRRDRDIATATGKNRLAAADPSVSRALSWARRGGGGRAADLGTAGPRRRTGTAPPRGPGVRAGQRGAPERHRRADVRDRRLPRVQLLGAVLPGDVAGRADRRRSAARSVSPRARPLAGVFRSRRAPAKSCRG